MRDAICQPSRTLERPARRPAATGTRSVLDKH